MYRRKVLTTVVATLLVLLSTAPVMATSDGNEAIKSTQASEWVAENYRKEAEGFAGFYADAIFAMKTNPLLEDEVNQAADLLANATDYYGEKGAVNPPALAKTIFTLDAVGRDITDVGGRTLVEELAATVTTDGAEAGRVGGTADVAGQAFAILNLGEYGHDTSSLGAWLSDQQCDDGGYSFNALCEGEEFFGTDVDTTSMALLALEESGQDDAATAARDFIDANRTPDGAYARDNANVNSSGMAAMALRHLGSDHEADATLSWILGNQFGAESGPQAHGGLRYLPDDPEPNAFATSQGLLAVSGFITDSVVAEAPNFEDVAEGSVFSADVTWLGHVEVTWGCNPPDSTRFCPHEPITRGELAAFLERALPKKDLGFDPTPSEEPITRAEVASVLAGALDLSEAGDRSFEDVPSDHPAAEDIGRLATAGITLGCNPGNNTRFCPEEPVTREQMAAMLHRFFDIDP